MPRMPRMFCSCLARLPRMPRHGSHASPARILYTLYIGRLIQTAGSNLCDERPENRAKMAFGPVFKHIIRLEHFEMFFYVLTLP